MNIKLKKFGFEAIQAKLDTAIANMDKTINNPLVAAAARAEGMAKRLVRVDSGHLRSTIGVEVLAPNRVFFGAGVLPGIKMFPPFYAGWVEWGTIKMAPRPYITPAAMVMEMELPHTITANFIAEWEGS